MTLNGKFMAGSDGPFLRQKVRDLLEAGTSKLLLDFSRVPYIDSTGLGFLAGSRGTVEEAGAKLVLAGVNRHVRKVLDDLKLSPLFDIVPDEPAGMVRLHESAGSAVENQGQGPKGGKSRRNSNPPTPSDPNPAS